MEPELQRLEEKLADELEHGLEDLELRLRIQIDPQPGEDGEDTTDPVIIDLNNVLRLDREDVERARELLRHARRIHVASQT